MMTNIWFEYGLFVSLKSLYLALKNVHTKQNKVTSYKVRTYRDIDGGQKDALLRRANIKKVFRF